MGAFTSLIVVGFSQPVRRIEVHGFGNLDFSFTSAPRVRSPKCFRTKT